MSHSPVHILLVEDDEDDCLLTQDMLGEIGDLEHNLSWANSFDAGIDMLTSSQVDICLVDFRIGGRTGLDFVEEATALGQSAPIVFLTGMGDRQTDMAALQAGAYDFLHKADLTPAILDRTIRYSISQAEGRRVLWEKTMLLQATLDNTNAGIAAVDADGALVSWNDKFVELLMKLSMPDHSEVASAAEALELRAGPLVEWMPMFARSWEEFEVSSEQILSISRNDTPDGGAVIVCHDITQHKLAERALRDAMLQAESASAAKSAFLANISHELRTPLNAIIGFAELMVGQAQGPVGCAEYESYVSFIKDSGDSLLKVINSTLDLARIEGNEYPLDLHCVLIKDVVSASLGRMGAIVAEKGIRFDVRMENEQLCCRGDENALAKVLDQILCNAVKFSEANGVVVVLARQAADRVVLEVTDHGIGMSAEDIERATVSFSQADQKLARKYEGVGLGLPLARALIDLQNGSMAIRSVPDEGTTIEITLPAAPAASGGFEDGHVVPCDALTA